MTPPLDPRLDRLVEFDERSRNFPIRATFQVLPAPRSYTWSVANWLDQGREGACVGFAWAHELLARPVCVPGLNDAFARDLYQRAQKIDQWPGGSYPGANPFYEGTSILAGAKIAKELGYIKEYRWAFGLDDLRLAVGFKGPAVIGINWYEGMFNPDAEGYLKPTGRIAGGHAILVYSNSERYKRFTVWNSWGRTWGRNGTAYISHEDMARLLSEQGEACIPVVRAKK